MDKVLWKLKFPNRFQVEIFVNESGFWLGIKNIRNRSERTVKLIDISKINELFNEIGINENILNYLRD